MLCLTTVGSYLIFTKESRYPVSLYSSSTFTKFPTIYLMTRMPTRVSDLISSRLPLQIQIKDQARSDQGDRLDAAPEANKISSPTH